MTVMLSTSLSMPVTLEAADIEPINRLPVVAQCCVGHVNIEPVSVVLDTSTQSQSVLCWTRQHRASQCCVGHVNIEPVSVVLDTST